MQAANVQGVGELFGSNAQLTRIVRLEAEVLELRGLVEELRVLRVLPRGSNPLRVMNLRDVARVEQVNAPVSSYFPQVRVSNR